MEFFILSNLLAITYPHIYGQLEWGPRYDTAQWDPKLTFKTERCPCHPEFFKSHRDGQLSVLVITKRVGDFIWSDYNELLVSEQVRALFAEHTITGFETRPATVRFKRGRQPIEGFEELVVTGEHPRAAPEARIRLVYRCERCGFERWTLHRRGLLVDEATWNGSDIFSLREYPQYRLVTRRLADLIIAHGLKPCVLVRSEDFRRRSKYLSDEDFL